MQPAEQTATKNNIRWSQVKMMAPTAPPKKNTRDPASSTTTEGKATLNRWEDGVPKIGIMRWGSRLHKSTTG